LNRSSVRKLALIVLVVLVSALVGSALTFVWVGQNTPQQVEEPKLDPIAVAEPVPSLRNEQIAGHWTDASRDSTDCRHDDVLYLSEDSQYQRYTHQGTWALDEDNLILTWEAYDPEGSDYADPHGPGSTKGQLHLLATNRFAIQWEDGEWETYVRCDRATLG
jgi:hypothetical protein